MKTQTYPAEIRPDFTRDDESRRLERRIAAESIHAHAHARRVFLAHACALLGIPLWLLAAGIGPYAIREAGLLLFPVFLVGFLVSVLAEWISVRRLDAAERALPVRRKTP